MAEPKLERGMVTRVDVPLGPGQPVVRIAAGIDADGRVDVVFIARAWPAEPWRDDVADGFWFPGSVAQAVVDALQSVL